jgi:hypothetical protein
LENLDTVVDINRAWETVRENIRTSAKESLCCYELKKHKSWFDEKRSKLLDKGKQAKLQRLQDPREINGDNLNNIRREASRHFSNNGLLCCGCKSNNRFKNNFPSPFLQLYDLWKS